MSQNHLLSKKNFAPLFWTQFFGAFNDNFFKNALVIYITFKVTWSEGGKASTSMTSGEMVALCAGLFILPFFLFSATAGQLADKFEKSKLIRMIKFAEIMIMSLAAIGFWNQNLAILFATLFLMGLQSTFFGPLKYGILPQHLKESELVGGNGLIEMGTFLAILLGTLLGGITISLGAMGSKIVAIGLVSLALLGWLNSWMIPTAPANDPDLKMDWHVPRQIKCLYLFAREKETVFLSILGICWFWFLGASFLTVLPDFCKHNLQGNEQIVTLFLTVFSIGIGLGSVLCAKFSEGKVELGLVPFGSIGLSLFTLDLFFASPSAPMIKTASLIGIREFLSFPSHWRILFDLTLIALHGGFFIVPLYALIQNHFIAKTKHSLQALPNLMGLIQNNTISGYFGSGHI